MIPELIDVLERKVGGRLCSKCLYSRRGIKDILGRVMRGINHYIDNNKNEG